MLWPPERRFTWRDGDRLVRFGVRALDEAPGLLAKRGFEGYALLSTRRALASAAGVAALADGAAAVLEVPSGGVPEAAAAVRGEIRGRPLVALGGGRVVDSAKAIAAVDGLDCAAVPTTLSGAEITAIHRLPAGAGTPRTGLVRPTLVIADPDLMASAPTAALTASAINALAHGAEALYAPGANPLCEVVGLRGAELIAAGLEASPERDRPTLALGAILCAWAIDGAGLGLHHALAQTLVRVLATPHAQTNAVLLPHVLRHLAPRAPRELTLLAEALGAAVPDAGLAAEQAAELASGAGAGRLSELGVAEESLAEVTEAVMGRPELAAAPGRPTSDEIEALLRAAL